MGRKPLSDEAKRNKQLAAYVTPSEDAVVNALVASHAYDGRSSVVRHALVALVRLKHPEHEKSLPPDLTS
jgi:Arc/MetJ-type ribon-helix-helix transcriptional regulator